MRASAARSIASGLNGSRPSVASRTVRGSTGCWSSRLRAPRRGNRYSASFSAPTRPRARTTCRPCACPRPCATCRAARRAPAAAGRPTTATAGCVPTTYLRREVAAHGPECQQADAQDHGQRPHPVGHAHGASQVGTLGAEDRVPDQRDREREQVAHVREHVDLQRRADQQHEHRADDVEDHRPVGHAVAVDVPEPAWQHAVMGVLPEAARAARDGIDHREHERDDQHKADEPLPELAHAEQCRRVGDEQLLGIAGLLGDHFGAEHGQHHDRDRDVDEEAEQALGRHRDLCVARGVAALADVAGSSLHGEHRPGEDEGPADDQLPAAVDAGGQGEGLDPAEVDLARMEEGQEARAGRAAPSTRCRARSRRSRPGGCRAGRG